MKLFHQRPIEVCMVFFVFLFPVHHSIYAQAATDNANVITSISQNGLTIANAKPAIVVLLNMDAVLPKCQ
jgi:hypothetical protein